MALRIARHPMCSIIWLGDDKSTDNLMLSVHGIPFIRRVVDVYKLSCLGCLSGLSNIAEGEIWYYESHVHHYYCGKCYKKNDDTKRGQELHHLQG